MWASHVYDMFVETSFQIWQALCIFLGGYTFELFFILSMSSEEKTFNTGKDWKFEFDSGNFHNFLS